MTTALALPNIADATLPATYERAKEALACCQRIDECKDWADKAAALASYAKQADDPTLHNLAVRIQARAVRRAGELLREFQAPHGGDRRSDQGAGADTLITQRRAAEQAGMSERQEHTAVRVAKVPIDEFEAAIESEQPPTITALAERGTEKRPVPPPAPGVADATTLIGMLQRLVAFCETHDPAVVAVGLFDHEKAEIREYLRVIGLWVEVFVAEMEGRADGSEVHRQAAATGDQSGDGGEGLGRKRRASNVGVA